MTTDDVLKCLRPLADGLDPVSGEVLPATSATQQPDTIRALMHAIKILEKVAGLEARQRQQPSNAGKPWSSQDDQQLASAFQAGATIQRLAIELRRTPGAVTARLVQLGMIDDRLGVLAPARGMLMQQAALNGTTLAQASR
jgi:hypothetical protein